MPSNLWILLKNNLRSNWKYLVYAVTLVYVVENILLNNRRLAYRGDIQIRSDESISGSNLGSIGAAPHLHISTNTSRTPAPPHTPTTSTTTPVLVVAYQRTGSTFLSGVFSHHPDAFMWFEPLDSVYVDLYATRHGYTVPVDIYSHSNGTRRTLPQYEYAAVVDTLTNILTCQFPHLPTDVLTHKFIWRFESTNGDMDAFKKCARSVGGHSTMHCGDELHEAAICPERFGTDLDGSYYCHQLMAHQTALQQARPDVRQDMEGYLNCTSAIRQRIGECVEDFAAYCSSKKVALAKAVRARMMFVEDLMKRIPTLRVIHMYRDPRPVAPSRRRLRVLSLYSKKSIVNEAKLYCEQLTEDILLRRKLEKLYPGQFLEVRFQDLAEQPVEMAAKIVDFMGLEQNEKVDSWVYEHTHVEMKRERVTRDARKTILEWRSRMDNSTLRAINEVCQQLYDTVGRAVWPYMQL